MMMGHQGTGIKDTLGVQGSRAQGAGWKGGSICTIKLHPALNPSGARQQQVTSMLIGVHPGGRQGNPRRCRCGAFYSLWDVVRVR